MATGPAAAKHIFISTSRFRDLLARGVITHQPSGKYRLDQVREEYILNAQKVMAGRGGDGGAGLTVQRAALAAAQTKSALLKTAILSGEYVSLTAVQRAFEEDLMVFRERSLSMPGATADALTPFTPKDRGEIETILRSEIYQMLNDLSNPGFVEKARGRAAQTVAVEELAQ